MLESFLSDFAFIKETLDKEGDHNFFGRDFSFFSTEPILFYHSDKDAIVYVNNHFTKEFNYTVDDISDWKYSIYPLLSSDDQESFRNAMKSLLEYDGESMPDASYRLIAKNKKHSYYRVKVRKLHKGYYFIQLENSIKTAVPVLKNKTADELMQEAEGILKFGFWMWDVATNKLFWTKGMYHLLGFDDVDDVAPTMDLLSGMIIKDEHYLDFEKRLKAGQLKESYRVKYHLRTAKGNNIAVSEHGRVETDDQGNITRVVGLTRDITLQEQSMKNLADYKTMMQENEAFLNYGTWESNPDGSQVQWTNGMYKMFGIEEAERETAAANAELYKQHLMGNNTEKLFSALEEGKDAFRREFEIKDKKGAVKILSTYAKVIRDSEKKIQRIIGTTSDVTQLKEYERTLEHKIEELNKSNRELEEFAYVASHDMQEPLRKISTFGNRLKTQLSGQLGEDGNLYLSRMLGASENMRNLIDNLLEFSKVSRNKQPYEPTNLNHILNQVMDDLDMRIAESDATVTVEPPLPEIEAIPSQMRQLFFNLLQNAIKFRKKDTPLIITVGNRQLDEKERKSYQLPEGSVYYAITVGDNGIGFEQQYAERIFQLFQRLEGKSEYPGTGIGLSICRKIVANHSGQIFAKSVPAMGTVFTIILPQDQ